MSNVADVASPDAPTVTNEKGAHQSLIEVRFDLIDGPALFQMAHVLYQGAQKYGENNWREIDIPDHINHLIMHAYAYLAGDRNDEHLSHMMCRSMFAQAVDLQRRPESDDNVQRVKVGRYTFTWRPDGYGGWKDKK